MSIFPEDNQQYKLFSNLNLFKKNDKIPSWTLV